MQNTAPNRAEARRGEASGAGPKETCMFTADDGGGTVLPAPMITAQRPASPAISRATQTPPPSPRHPFLLSLSAPVAAKEA